LAESSEFNATLGIFYMPQIYDMGPTALLPSEGSRAEDFFALKNPTASAGFEPANLGTTEAAYENMGTDVFAWVRGHRKMNQVLGAFRLLDFTMLHPVLAWRAF
jgi:hypothetical protein